MLRHGSCVVMKKLNGEGFEDDREYYPLEFKFVFSFSSISFITSVVIQVLLVAWE